MGKTVGLEKKKKRIITIILLLLMFWFILFSIAEINQAKNVESAPASPNNLIYCLKAALMNFPARNRIAKERGAS